MKQFILSALSVFLCISMTSAQSPTPEKVRILTAHSWKISAVSHKYPNSDKFVAFDAKRSDPCFYGGNFQFNPDETIDIKVDKAVCETNEFEGKWQFNSNYSEISVKLDSLPETVKLKVIKLSAYQVTIESSFEDQEKGTIIERMIFEPEARPGILMSQLYEMTKLTASDHATAIVEMGFTSNGHNPTFKYYSFKKGTEGELKLYYDDNEQFKSIVYSTYAKLPQSSVWEFSNNNRFYSVSSVQTFINQKWLRTDKHYKEGYIYEASESDQTFTARRSITEKEKKDLTTGYRNTSFPEFNVVRTSEVKTAQATSTVNVPPVSNFCKELKVILTAIENRKLGDVVDYNKALGMTRSWYEAKVPLDGFTSLQGQNMWGNLTFSGALKNSNTEDNLPLYNQLVIQMESCLGSSYSKKAGVGSVKFTHKTLEGLTVTVDYWGEGKSVRISIERSAT